MKRTCGNTLFRKLEEGLVFPAGRTAHHYTSPRFPVLPRAFCNVFHAVSREPGTAGSARGLAASGRRSPGPPSAALHGLARRRPHVATGRGLRAPPQCACAAEGVAGARRWGRGTGTRSAARLEHAQYCGGSVTVRELCAFRRLRRARDPAVLPRRPVCGLRGACTP